MIDFKTNANPLIMDIYRSNKKIGLIDDSCLKLDESEKLDALELKQVLDIIGPSLWHDDCGLNEETLRLIGTELISDLRLKVKSNGRVDLESGDKTPLGLARTIIAIIRRKI